MSIGPKSRYLAAQGGSVSRVVNSAGVYNITTLRTVPAQTGPFTLYTWSAGDRPDTVAYRQLGDPSMWWAIFDFNPEIIDPLNVPPGTVVRIPSSVAITSGTITQ